MPAVVQFGVHAVIAIFVIMDPLGVAPVFVAMTEGYPLEKKNGVIRRALLTVFLTLMIFMLIGELIFRVFNITIGAFSIAGGILLFSIAMNMLYAKRSGAKITTDEEQERGKKGDISIVPLAIPLLSGPGAITTVMVLKERSQSIFEDIIIILSIFVVCTISYFIFKRANALVNRLGETGLRVFTRLMGLILAVIAVQFVINGIRDALPQILGR